MGIGFRRGSSESTTVFGRWQLSHVEQYSNNLIPSLRDVSCSLIVESGVM
jgi:hypothetical protein